MGVGTVKMQKHPPRIAKIGLVAGLWVLTALLPFSLSSYATKDAPTKSPNKPSNLPQWVALAKSKVHSRSGPGKHHPIRFIYETLFLPFKVLAFKDGWYRVEDFEGDRTWIMAPMVTSKATTFLITAPCPLYKKPTSTKPYAMLAEGSLLKMRSCQENRCLGVIRTFEGWIEPAACGWGALPAPPNPIPN